MPLTEQAQAFVNAIKVANAPGWHEMPPAESREVFASFGDVFGEAPEVQRVKDHLIDNRIPARVYADTQKPAPAVMYFHGGGWVLGNLDTHDSLCRRLAKQSGCVLVAVDYRLAPEHPFPAAFDDCVRATRFVADHPKMFGSTGKMAVMGDSAGGNLAATVALHARDHDGPSIDLQVLIYPVIEPDFSSSTYENYAEGFGLTRVSMQWFWQQYLGSQPASPFVIPSTAETLAGLPASHVITAEYDVLRDEGESFAEKLKLAGVPTTIRRYDGNLHGFIHFAGAFDDGMQAAKDIGEMLQSHLLK
ncbi:MAG: alpha/beta hydrolase [Planctomycetota bacterium]